LKRSSRIFGGSLIASNRAFIIRLPGLRKQHDQASVKHGKALETNQRNSGDDQNGNILSFELTD
jgi:hypothetical protein